MLVRLKPFFAVICLMMFLSACGSDNQTESISITELKAFEDRAMNFGMSAPTNWYPLRKVGAQAAFYSSQEVVQRFTNFQAGPTGAKVAIRIMGLDSTMTLDELIEKSKEFGDASMYTAVTDVQIGGHSGKKYGVKFEGYPDGVYQGERYFGVMDDTVATMVELLAFGGNFEALKPKFDEIVKTVKLGYELPVAPRVDTVFEGGEQFQPSENVITMRGSGFSLKLPDNFQGRSKKSASAKSGTQYRGKGSAAPVDCYIQVEVFDASKQKDLDKIANENLAKYSASSANSAQVAGLDARVLNDTRLARNKVDGKVYFAVKGENMYRVSVYYYKPEAEIWKPVFDKALASLKIN